MSKTTIGNIYPLDDYVDALEEAYFIETHIRHFEFIKYLISKGIFIDEELNKGIRELDGKAELPDTP
jgi:hypothetical protein